MTNREKHFPPGFHMVTEVCAYCKNLEVKGVSQRCGKSRKLSIRNWLGECNEILFYTCDLYEKISGEIPEYEDQI